MVFVKLYRKKAANPSPANPSPLPPINNPTLPLFGTLLVGMQVLIIIGRNVNKTLQSKKSADDKGEGKRPYHCDRCCTLGLWDTDYCTCNIVALHTRVLVSLLALWRQQQLWFFWKTSCKKIQMKKTKVFYCFTRLKCEQWEKFLGGIRKRKSSKKKFCKVRRKKMMSHEKWDSLT